MVCVWYLDDDVHTDKREPHMENPGEVISLDKLRRKTGVEYFSFDSETVDQNEVYSELKTLRGYTYEDRIEISKSTLPDFESKLEAFYTEHLHADEEVRFVTSGSGYFDVRDTDDKWLRILVVQNDLIILPAGIYHRFTLDNMSSYIIVRRLFAGEPVWKPYNRPADQHPARALYIKLMAGTK